MFCVFLLLDTTSVITAVINRYVFKYYFMNICSRRNCSGKLSWSGDREGKEHADIPLGMNTDMGPDKSWNYLLLPLSRVDNIFVIAHCCLCLSSLAGEPVWSSSMLRIVL